MLSIQVLKPRQSWSPRPCVRYQNGTPQALEYIYIKLNSKLVEALCTYVSRLLLRDAPDGATVYVDLWADSASGVSCHYVRSRRVRIKTAPIINTSLLSITLCIEFNPCENWKLFKQKWQNYSVITHLERQDTNYQVALLLHTLGDEALKVYNGFHFHGDERHRTVDEIIAKFD